MQENNKDNNTTAQNSGNNPEVPNRTTTGAVGEQQQSVEESVPNVQAASVPTAEPTLAEVSAPTEVQTAEAVVRSGQETRQPMVAELDAKSTPQLDLAELQKTTTELGEQPVAVAGKQNTCAVSTTAVGGSCGGGQKVNLMPIQQCFEQSQQQQRDDLYKRENKGRFSTLFKVGAIYFAIILLIIGVRIASNLGLFDGLGLIEQSITTSVLIQVVIMLAVSVGLFSLAKKQKIRQTLSDFSYKKISGKVVGFAVVLGIAVFFLNGYVSSLFTYLIELLGYETVPTTASVDVSEYTWVYFLISVVCSCLLPAICEETAHRGLLLTGIKRYGVGKAIIISGLLFGLIHLNIYQFFYATLIGWVLGALTVASNSIYPAMIVHFMNNFLSTCGEFASVNGLRLFDLSFLIEVVSTLFGSIIGNLFLFAFIIAMLFVGVHMFLMIYKEQRFEYVKKRIVQKNLYFFLSSDNLEINEHNTSDVMFQRFFGTPNIHLASVLYLAEQSKKPNSFWDNFDETYLEHHKKGITEYAFIIGAIVMGAVATIFTFIWGVF